MSDIERAPERAPRRFDPFADLERLREQMWDRSRTWPASWFETLGGEFVPAADIEEADDAWIVDVELPGVDKKDVEVEVHGHTVVIKGERKEKERKGVLRQKTRVAGSFRYEVTLPGEFDEEAVEATLDNGELSVRLPKTEADQPRKIAIG